MFGTLRLPKDGLSDDQRRLYRGHFCGLCHSLDQFGGKLASLLTNYDTTFWLLVLAALEEHRHGPLPVVSRGCTALPFRQVPVVEFRPATRRMVAALTLALVGAKVEDDRLDGDRPWVGWAFLPLRSSWARAGPTLDEVGFPRDAVEGLARWQRAMEAGGQSLNDLTQPTQNLLQNLFGFIATYTEQESFRPILEELGRALGLWIYLYGAWNDQARDARSGAFNALTRFPQSQAELAGQMLHALNHLQRSLQRLPLGPRRPLLEEQVGRLRALTLREFGVAPAGNSRATACWVLGGLAAASLTPRASVACDGCDCGGCDCGGCECPNCECHACDCNPCECNACDCSLCESSDLCMVCDPACCDSCKCGSDLDCCCFVDTPSSKPKPKPKPTEDFKEDEIPGTTRVKGKYPWSKRRRRQPPQPEPPANDPSPPEPPTGV